MKRLVFILLIFIYTVSVSTVSAHPGNTASDGCHYCRTNCDRWGVAWNERHCHGGGAVNTAPPVVQQMQQIIYPTSTPISIKPTGIQSVSTTPTPTPKESFWRQLLKFMFNL